MLDRLALTPARLKGIADDVRQVCNLADPVGQVIDGDCSTAVYVWSAAACRSALSG